MKNILNYDNVDNKKTSWSQPKTGNTKFIKIEENALIALQERALHLPRVLLIIYRLCQFSVDK